MSILLYPLLAVAIVSAISLVGLFAISLKEATLDNLLFILLAFSAGSILGAAFLDLLPEAIEFFGGEQLSSVTLFVTLGFLGFFFLERFIYWYHGHVHGYEGNPEKKMTTKRFVYLNVLGDGIHNLLDGMLITAGFLIAIPAGMAATVAVIFHEIPQEIGDFGVLVYGGLTRYKALLANLMSALTAFAGVFISSYLSAQLETSLGFLIAFGAGGFIYLGASELIPELHKEQNIVRSMVQFALLTLGVIFVWSLAIILPE